MSVYVSQTTNEEHGDHLHIVRTGVEQRLPLVSGTVDTVRVPVEAPEWADRIARENGYAPLRESNPVAAERGVDNVMHAARSAGTRSDD